MPWTRGSSLLRSLACPGSTVLPAGPDLRSDRTIEAADWGTMAHRWAATGEIQSVRKNHEALFRKKLVTVWGSLEAAEESRRVFWPESGMHEVSVAYNCEQDLVEWCPGPHDPDTWKAQFDGRYITGTCDYVGQLLGDPWVSDLKTGRVPPPPEDPQVRFYTACIWRIRNRPDRCISSVDWWPRYPVYSLPSRVDIEVTAETLDKFLWECRIGYDEHGTADGLMIRGRATDTDTRRLLVEHELVRPGSHCLYCPSANNCPIPEDERDDQG